jgi:hypothetical protein
MTERTQEWTATYDGSGRLVSWRPTGPERAVVPTIVALRLTEAIANKAAIDGLVESGHSRDWKAQMDADDEYLAALMALRTAIDGRPR